MEDIPQDEAQRLIDDKVPTVGEEVNGEEVEVEEGEQEENEGAATAKGQGTIHESVYVKHGRMEIFGLFGQSNR